MLVAPDGPVAVAVCTPVAPETRNSASSDDPAMLLFITEVQLSAVYPPALELHAKARHPSPVAVVPAEVGIEIAVDPKCALPPASLACPPRGDVISTRMELHEPPVLHVDVPVVPPPTVFVD